MTAIRDRSRHARQHWSMTAVAMVVLLGVSQGHVAEAPLFKEAAAVLEQHCLRCHGEKSPKGGLSLTSRQTALAGGDTGPAIVPGKAQESLLIEQVTGGKPRMPRGSPPLKAAKIAILKRWLDAGAPWQEGVVLKDRQQAGETWWSLKALARPAVPIVKNANRVRNSIDAFILKSLEEQRLTPNPDADARTLIRRLTFDLHGLPPSPDEIEQFCQAAARDPQAAVKELVERLLASPRYGERWGRHWLDVVHYGDTHGYDKDKLRPNAWPYRDYVIRAFNEDRPYRHFIEEQLAGDVLSPGTRDGIVALGFLAAGPWDFVGQVELREGTLDKQITRNLDRDDMVATAMNTFTSLTVQCARCHDHKFDPITQEDYYSLQAVFAAVDRADRRYDLDPSTAHKRDELTREQAALAARRQALHVKVLKLAGPDLASLDRQIEQLAHANPAAPRPEFGFHSQIEPRQDVVKWVQVDLGKPTPIDHIIYVGCHDDFNNIGAGFGFPVRYKIEISDDVTFKSAHIVADYTRADVPNPGVRPQSVPVGGKNARYVRVTATRLAPRSGDYIFALAELSVLTPQGANAAAGATVTALDSIEAPVRWRKANLVDGYYYGIGKKDSLAEIARLHERRRALLEHSVDAQTQRDMAEIDRLQKQAVARLAALPPQAMIYAAATHFAPAGSFSPTHGKPRPIYLLKRGSEKNPGGLVGPGAVACVASLESRFSSGTTEGERRAALARWIADPHNPLTWRSIVNRVWAYHFGQGLVETPNDFGKMGGKPSHPELLDWLAMEFRDSGQSLKALHRLIVTSATYRQSCAHNADNAKADSGNRLLWRMNRRKLEAEAIRDSVLMVSGKLDLKEGGPGYKPFGFKDDHSPHYKYEEHNPDDPASHRRSVYRFLVRSVPEPFMETLDCADPSLIVERRNETLTALQALALLNNRFMVRMAEHFAARVEKMQPDLPARIVTAYRLALGRAPTSEETQVLVEVATKHGLANACRLIFNMNEFCFVD